MRPVTFFFYHIPVDDIPQGVHVVGAAVLVIQVVRVFPHVKSEKRFQSGAYRVTSVTFFGDMQFTVLVYGQPGPTRTKQSDCCCIEFFLEVLEAAEVTFDCFSQFASGFFLLKVSGRIAGSTDCGSILVPHY